MPNRSRQKGDRFERECVQRLREAGIIASRVPLSGSAGGDFSGDLRVGSKPLRFECKTRKRAWLDLFGWLKDGNDGLLIKADRTDTLVVLTLDAFTALFVAAETPDPLA